MISSKGLKYGLGFRGIFGGIVLGAVCLFQPIFGSPDSFIWVKVLIVLASVVYVVFSLVWDKRYLPLTNLQLLTALGFLVLSIVSGNILFIAAGLFGHALWDLWHLITERRYVPWWYAGACVYVDFAASGIILAYSNF